MSGGDPSGRPRTVLAQHRSRRTRDAIIEAASRLWAAAGTEAGFEATTVEEIARAAGVTRGTFYFHFAGKTDVLLQLNAATEELMAAAAVTSMDDGYSLDVALDRAAAVLDEQSQQRPRALLAQIVREYHRDPSLTRERSVFRQLLPKLFERAQERGEVPSGADAERIAAVAAAIIYSACQAWAEGRSAGLYDDLRYGLAVVLAGVRATPPLLAKP